MAWMSAGYIIHEVSHHTPHLAAVAVEKRCSGGNHFSPRRLPLESLVLYKSSQALQVFPSSTSLPKLSTNRTY